MAEEMRALYLIAGTDGAKIDATRGRLRARAEREGGAGALEVFEPGEGRGMPDHEALLAAIPAMSLMGARRYLLADGVERWRERQLEAVAAALAELPPDLTLVLIARAKAPAKLMRAVKAADGEIHEFEAPKARELPRRLVGRGRAARLPARPGRGAPAGRADGRQPGAPAARAGAAGAVGGGGGRGRPRRPAGDGRRHLRGGGLVALGRAARSRPGGGAADRRAADRAGGERHRPDLRPRLAPARRLRRRGAAGRGRPAQAGGRLAEDAPLRRQAAGRPPARGRARRSAVPPPRRSPTSSSGAAAAPTTATSWRSPSP